MINKISELISLPGKRLAFFAGSFDPIHHGHLKVAEFVLKKYADQIIICVHSHNAKKRLTPIRKRLEIIKKLLPASPFHRQIQLCSPVFLHGIENNKFVKTAKQLIESNKEVFILRGQDTFTDKKNKKHYILSYFPHLIHNRGKVEIPLSDFLRGPFIRFKSISNMSSTETREKIAAGKRVHICDDVHNYILKKKLYIH